MLAGRRDDRRDVHVRQHRALGDPGGAGGIDDRGEGVGRHGLGPPPEFAEPGQVGFGVGEGRQHVRFGARLGRVERNHALEAGELGPDRGDLLGLRGGRDEDEPCPGIPEQDGDLIGGQRRVDRHHHRAERQRGVVDHGPLGPVLREDGNPVSRDEAPGVEHRGDLGDSLLHLAISDGVPRPVPLEAKGFHSAEAVHSPVEDPCDGIPLNVVEGRHGGGRLADWGR